MPMTWEAIKELAESEPAEFEFAQPQVSAWCLREVMSMAGEALAKSEQREAILNEIIRFAEREARYNDNYNQQVLDRRCTICGAEPQQVCRLSDDTTMEWPPDGAMDLLAGDYRPEPHSYR